MLIGRSRRCDVVLRDSHLVSRRHCKLERRDGGWFLRDLRSQNGTWIDGERIDHAFLSDGDRFVAGDVILRIRSDGVEPEGTADPRSIRERPRLRDQGAALALVSLPIIAGVIYLAISAGSGAPAASRAAGEPAVAALDPLALPAPAASTAEEISLAAPASPTFAAAGEETARPAAPAVRRYAAEDLIAIAETVDRELAAREAEMAALLEAGVDPAAPERSSPGWDLELELREGEVAPPSLAESWSGIAGEGMETRTGALSGSEGGITAEGTGTDGVPSEPVPATRGESVPASRGGTSPVTEAVVVPADALFTDAALADLVREVVAEGIAKIDRYHVRAVSLEPLRPLVGQLGDLDGPAAARGLLELRAHALVRLREVYRRSRELSPQVARSERDLAGRPEGGAEEREDELTLRLADIVAEHLETLVLIRDEIDDALLDEGKTAFVIEALHVAIETREEHLLDRALAMSVSREIWDTVPILIEAVGSPDAGIRKKSRESLESITGERPGSTRRAWREWWQTYGQSEKEA